MELGWGEEGWDGVKHRSPSIPPIPPYQIPQAPKSYFAKHTSGHKCTNIIHVKFIFPFLNYQNKKTNICSKWWAKFSVREIKILTLGQI